MTDLSTAAAPSAPEVEPEPIAQLTSFDAFPIDEDVRAGIRGLGFAAPTDVQAAVIVPALAGRDLLVQSKTGSGKTCAFGIPMVARLQARAGAPGQPHGLVLAPTRELAHQVSVELQAVAAHRGTRILTIYGGVPIQRQLTALQAGVDIVVATPGRLLDHLRRQNMSLDAIRMVVLDEADEMLSMGFWDDVTELLKLCPASRQTMLFSATLPYEVAKAASQFLTNAARVNVSGDDLNVAGINNCIYHVLANVPKPRQMLYALEIARPDSAVIFCNTRSETDMLAKYLTQAGLVAEPLSGTLKQRDRERVMGRIKRGELRFMVATDIAARGIDINDLSHVFNYSLPEFSEVYLHRVGRTGRIGKIGTAISLVDGKGLGTLTQLERDFNVKVVELTLPPEEDILRARSIRIMKELADKAAMAEISQHLPVAQGILEGSTAPQVVAYLLKSYFNAQADQARRNSVDAMPELESDEMPRSRSRMPRPARPARPALSAAAANAPVVAAVQPDGLESPPAEEEEGLNGPRRRRRRRRRGGAEGATERELDGEVAAPGRRAAVVERIVTASEHELEVVSPYELLGLPRPAAAAAVARPQRPPSGSARAVQQPWTSEAGTVARGQTSPSQAASADATAADYASVSPLAAPLPTPPIDDGLARIRVNIGFDDGFKGRGAVAKKIAALAGLNEGIIVEVEAGREQAVLKASPEIADLVLERVDGAQLGKKVISVTLTQP